MSKGESYLDIVWRQFRKKRAAYWSLWVLGALFLLATFAPLIASNVPLVFHDGDQTIYPWWHALFNTDQPQDFLFNMALLALGPWTLLALATNWIARRRGIAGRQRLAWVGVEFVAMLTSSLVVFSPFFSQHVIDLRPSNEYWSRTFPQEQFASPNTKWGVYPPIPYGPSGDDLELRYKPPWSYKETKRTQSNQAFIHFLGTADTGQDVLVGMIYGTRISMTVGFVAVGIYVTIGVVMGALAGYFGGFLDMLISRIIEVVLLFPSFFLILTVVGLLPQQYRMYIIMVVIGLTGWTGVARLVRGEVLKQRSLDYTLSAQALGASHRRIIFRHILPNALSPVLVTIPFGIADAIIIEASLSLLGFGVPPPAPSWGTLLNIAQNDYHNWWLVVIPSIAIFGTVTVFNLVGSGLRDAMDPRLRI